LVDDRRAQEQRRVADEEFAQGLLGAAGHWGDDGRLGDRLPGLLAALLLPGCRGCATGGGQRAAGRVDGGGEVVQGCGASAVVMNAANSAGTWSW
jgi:hypothetical protein